MGKHSFDDKGILYENERYSDIEDVVHKDDIESEQLDIEDWLWIQDHKEGCSFNGSNKLPDK